MRCFWWAVSLENSEKHPQRTTVYDRVDPSCTGRDYRPAIAAMRVGGADSETKTCYTLKYFVTAKYWPVLKVFNAGEHVNARRARYCYGKSVRPSVSLSF